MLFLSRPNFREHFNKMSVFADELHPWAYRIRIFFNLCIIQIQNPISGAFVCKIKSSWVTFLDYKLNMKSSAIINSQRYPRSQFTIKRTDIEPAFSVKEFSKSKSRFIWLKKIFEIQISTIFLIEFWGIENAYYLTRTAKMSAREILKLSIVYSAFFLDYIGVKNCWSLVFKVRYICLEIEGVFVDVTTPCIANSLYCLNTTSVTWRK